MTASRHFDRRRIRLIATGSAGLVVRAIIQRVGSAVRIPHVDRLKSLRAEDGHIQAVDLDIETNVRIRGATLTRSHLDEYLDCFRVA